MAKQAEPKVTIFIDVTNCIESLKGVSLKQGVTVYLIVEFMRWWYDDLELTLQLDDPDEDDIAIRFDRVLGWEDLPSPKDHTWIRNIKPEAEGMSPTSAYVSAAIQYLMDNARKLEMLHEHGGITFHWVPRGCDALDADIKSSHEDFSAVRDALGFKERHDA